jgi:hypothetical protein
VRKLSLRRERKVMVLTKVRKSDLAAADMLEDIISASIQDNDSAISSALAPRPRVEDR